jgi:murein DD-endopeptidase MepM/ murein hydrolase activator NlpD
MRRRKKIVLAVLAVLILGPLLIPERAIVPVQGATSRDWNPRSFWYEPWGASGVHKGIDIFAPKGQPVLASAPGIVIYSGKLGIGGNVVAILGPKWHVHYFAHLDSSSVRTLSFVRTGRVVGKVGNSGNAAGKQPHLHFAILSVLPRPWAYSTHTQGWKQMFYLNPGTAVSGT